MGLKPIDKKGLRITKKSTGIPVDHKKLTEMPKFTRKQVDDPKAPVVTRKQVKDMIQQEFKRRDSELGIY